MRYGGQGGLDIGVFDRGTFQEVGAGGEQAGGAQGAQQQIAAAPRQRQQSNRSDDQKRRQHLVQDDVAIDSEKFEPGEIAGGKKGEQDSGGALFHQGVAAFALEQP